MATVIVGEIQTAFSGAGQGVDSQQQQPQQQLLSYHRSGTPPQPASYTAAAYHRPSSYTGADSYASPISQVTECGLQTFEYTPLENDLDVRLYQAHYADSSEHLLESDQLAAGSSGAHNQTRFVASNPHSFGHSISIATNATTNSSARPAPTYDELGGSGAHSHIIRADETHKTYHLLESEQQMEESGGHEHEYRQQNQQHYHQEAASPILSVAPPHYELSQPDYYAHPYHVPGGLGPTQPLAAHAHAIAYDPHQYHLVDPSFAALGYDQPIVSDQYDPAAELDSCLQQFNEYHEDENEDCNQRDEGEQLERDGSGSSSFIDNCFNGGEYCAAEGTMDETNWDHQYHGQHVQHSMINLDEHQRQQQQQQQHQRVQLEQQAQPVSLLAANQDRRHAPREVISSGKSFRSSAVGGDKSAPTACKRETRERLRIFIENRIRRKAGASSLASTSAGGGGQLEGESSSRASARRPSIFEPPRPSWQSQAPYGFRPRSNRDPEEVSRVAGQSELADASRNRRRPSGQRRLSLAGARRLELDPDPSQPHQSGANVTMPEGVIREPVLLNMLKGNEATSIHLDQYWSDHNERSEHDRSWEPRASQIADELEDTGVQTRASKRRRLQQQLEQQQQQKGQLGQSDHEKRLSSLGPSSSSCGSYSSVGMMTEEEEVESETNSPPERL